MSSGVRFTAFALAGLGAVLAGCNDANPADAFAGDWRYDDVMSTVACPNVEALSQPPAPNKTFGRGASSALVDLSPSPLGLGNGVFCDFAFDVSGPYATIQPDQTCFVDTVDTLTIDRPDMSQPPLWSFTLNSATAAEEIAKGTVHISATGSASGMAESCLWTLTGHLTRLTKD